VPVAEVFDARQNLRQYCEAAPLLDGEGVGSVPAAASFAKLKLAEGAARQPS